MEEDIPVLAGCQHEDIWPLLPLFRSQSFGKFDLVVLVVFFDDIVPLLDHLDRADQLAMGGDKPGVADLGQFLLVAFRLVSEVDAADVEHLYAT